LIGLKDQVRVCGIDDAPFEFGNRTARATVVGAVVRIPAYLEGVLRFDVAVDGFDATDEIAKALTASRFLEQIRAVMIDGITLAGFNVIDIKGLSSKLSIPVITITRDRPDMESIESALKKHFEDWGERLTLISAAPMEEIETEQNPVYIGYAGIGKEEAVRLTKETTIRGAVPEPIRMAHIIASGIIRGESKGKA
jgi:hypothetical protein